MSLFIGNMDLGATIKQQCGKEFDQKVDFVTKEVGGGAFQGLFKLGKKWRWRKTREQKHRMSTPIYLQWQRLIPSPAESNGCPKLELSWAWEPTGSEGPLLLSERKTPKVLFLMETK